MCSHGMFCGSGSFKRMAAEDDDDQACKTPRDASSPPSSSPKGLKKKAGKNPYSGRGLDKFSSVMSELEARREQIMASAGPQGVAMVRFMHANSDDWIPIVVRLRDHPTRESTKRQAAAVDSQAEAPKEARVGPATSTSTSTAKEKVMKMSFSWGSDNNNYNKKKNKKNNKEGEGERWSWRRGHNWVVMMVIILACLMVFGRVFAICCTSIWWYLVPTLKGEEEGHSIRRSMKKKDYGRRMSANKGINN